ncbi:MAG TPA: 16S rRNA (cytosine(1402)-N(4))-methyltransferase, partial [Acidimicrobiales bacterium]|nr:16S rRNA (cytosine(1402)-N(4))-methyltransferase [Acidimicrobiales bacterium]
MSIAAPTMRAPGQFGLERSPLASGTGVPFSTRLGPRYPGRNPGTALAEGLLMSPADPSPPFEHRPVMVSEVLALFSVVPPGVVLDATVGAGGHAKALLTARPDLSIVGLDRDAEAAVAARGALAGFGERARVVKERFDRLGDVLDSLG